MPNLDKLGLVVSKKRAGALERKSSRQMRPWRSPTASWRVETSCIEWVSRMATELPAA